jgi:hypothetical protein
MKKIRQITTNFGLKDRENKDKGKVLMCKLKVVGK